MASAHIEISGGASRINGELRSTINRLQSVVDDVTRLKGIMDQIASDSDWASLASALGVSEANAETVYNLWGSMKSDLDGDTFVVQVLQRLG